MQFKQGSNVFKTLIIGAGPAGTGPLVNAQQRGLLQQVLDEGIAIVDRSPHMGSGSIGQHIINSDTIGGTFLECLINQDGGPFQSVIDSSAKQNLEQYRKSAAPLQIVGQYMGEIGHALQQVIDSHPVSQFFPGVEARSIHRLPDGTFRTTFVSSKGDEHFEIMSKYVVTALGARQLRDQTLSADIIPSLNLADYYANKSLLTGHILTADGAHEMEHRLKASPNRKVVIIGASHSTFSAAWVLLNRTGIPFEEAANGLKL